METTILLSKVFGVYLLVGGLAYIFRRKYFMSMIHDFVKERALRLIVAVSEFIAGLFLIFTHNIWDSVPAGIISLVGWMMALEGLAYLFLSDRAVAKMLKFFNTKAWYSIGGIISIVGGIYLVDFGFGLGLF